MKILAADDVEDKALVRVGKVEVVKTVLVGEVEVSLGHFEAHSRTLHQHLHVNRLIGLHADDKLVARGFTKEVPSDRFKLNAHLDEGVWATG